MAELSDDGRERPSDDDLEIEWAHADPAGAVVPLDDEPERPLLFPTLDQFVVEYLAEVCWRDTEANDVVWCKKWWAHTAAVVRLEALWRSFESLRWDPALGMSVWLRDHADVHMAVLLSPSGPFKGCVGSNGHDGERLRVLNVEEAPDGLFMPGD